VTIGLAAGLWHAPACNGKGMGIMRRGLDRLAAALAQLMSARSSLEVFGGMNTWYFNKIAGAVLCALLIAFGAGTLADIMRPHHASKPGYVLPVKDAPASGPAAAAPAFSFAEIAPLLKTSNAEDGRAAFAPCRACHTTDKGGKPLVGPNLWGVLGRDIATNPDFPRYSSALKGHKGQWTLENLAAYLHDPRGTIPGNQMAFLGVKSNPDLANLLMYLRSLSDSPVALPN